MTDPKRPKHTAPFLVKLQTICSTLPYDIGRWNGDKFDVDDPERFFEFAGRFFSGSKKTFYRQLAYFRFTRSELPPKGFSFMNKDFQQGDFERMALIKRITSSGDDSGSVEAETRMEKLETSLGDLRTQVAQLTTTVNSLTCRLNEDSEAMLLSRFEDSECCSTCTSGELRRSSVLDVLDVLDRNEQAGPRDTM